MRSSTSAILTALIGFTIANPCTAREIQRLQLDLDGGGKTEAVQIMIVPAKENWRSQMIVNAGGSEYTDEFFSAESGLPDVHVIAIDRHRTQRQLLIQTPEADTCIYHVLAYASKKLILLLRFDSGPDCRPPQPLGNGQLQVSTWEGFWAKEDRYRLSQDGQSLVEEPKGLYTVEVAGAAGASLVLEGAECVARAVMPGAYIRVKVYDSVKDLYRLESTDGGCGWIPAAKLKPPNEIVKELPWAG